MRVSILNNFLKKNEPVLIGVLFVAVARNNLFYVCIGLSIGTACGYIIGTWIARPYYPSPVMKAVACLAFRDPDVSCESVRNCQLLS